MGEHFSREWDTYKSTEVIALGQVMELREVQTMRGRGGVAGHEVGESRGSSAGLGE